MADKSLQKRSMRKAVERVDVGVFGVPMRIRAWMHAKRSTVGGLIAMSAAQAAAGTLVALLAGFFLGVQVNAFSLSILLFFAIGCAVGGTISFSIWSAVLIGLTGLVAGLVKGAWVTSPAWWRIVGADWDAGKALPFWFVIAVPIWMLFWVAGSYGVSRIVDKIFEALSLSISFKAASRFSSDEQRIHEEGLAESNVSSVEARSLIDHGSDGTDAVVAASPRTVEPGVRMEKEIELGGEPQGLPQGFAKGPSYDLLDEDMDDPDVQRAMGLGSGIGGSKPTSFVIDSDAPASDAGATRPGALPMELSEPDLPAVPADATGPLRRVTPPKVDALASRAMVKKLQQLLTSFEMALFQNEDEGFIRDNEDELALISEEQKAMLRAMANSGPLLGAIAAVQSERASDFLIGRAAPPATEGTGSFSRIETAVAEASANGMLAADEQLADGESPSDEAEDGGIGIDDDQVVVADSIAKMGSIFSGFTRRGRQAIADEGEVVPVASSPLDVSPSSPTVADVPVPDVSEKGAVPAMIPDSPVMSPRPPERSLPPIPRPPGEKSVEAVHDAASASDVLAASVDVEAAPGTIASIGADGRTVVFDVDIKHGSNEGSGGEDAAAVIDNEEEDGSDGAISGEDEVSALIFDRRICKQVFGLISGSDSPDVKSKDVLSFEHENPGISVAQVLNSRSFDEHVGSTEAVAVRHMWRDVQKVLSQSSVERLVADFERLNDRGRAMVDEPHMMTSAAFYAFEGECSRTLTSAMTSDETIAATVALVNIQRDILDSLRDIKRRREEAAVAPTKGDASTVVRQKVPAGEDVEATRGRGMLSSVLGGARHGKSLLRGADSARKETPAASAPEPTDDPSMAPVDAQDPIPQSVPMETPVVANRVPVYGDDDYVSPHEAGTDEHDFDMEMHAQGIRMRRKQAELAQERAERERVERQQREEREARERQEAIDASRSEERRQMLERDTAFVSAERERVEALARDATARAEQQAADAIAAKTRAERETRENARSIEDQRVLEEHRARLDGHSLPLRFRDGDIPQRFIRLTDLRDQRKKFYSLSVSGKIEGLDDVPEAVASPAKRSSMMMDVMIGMESSAIYEKVLGILDPPSPEDIEGVRRMVGDDDELKFVVSIQDAIKTGIASERALREADAKLLEMHEAVLAMKGVATIRDEVGRLGGELAAANERRVAVEGERDEVERRAADAEAARDKLALEVDRLRKAAAGIVEDDFQRILEKYAKPVSSVPVQGIFLLANDVKKCLALIVTTPASAVQGGVVKVGDRMMPFRDMIDFVLDVSRSMMTETREVFFTDRTIRPLLDHGASGVTLVHIERSVEAFAGAAEIAEVVIDPEDLIKGE